jgi:hypothetical protein
MIDLTKRSDVKLIEQSLRNNWDIPDRAYADLPARLIEIVVSREAGGSAGPYLYGDRLRLSAIRCLIMMQGQLVAAAPQQVDLNINGHFAFDMETASTLSREEMSKVTDAFRLLDNGGSNGRRNGNGSDPRTDT